MGVQFTRESAARIADTVRGWESQNRGLQFRRHRYNSGGNFKHMYKMTKAGTGVKMRPGTWERGGHWAGTGFPVDYVYDVASLASVSDGTVLAFAVRMSGAGISGGIDPSMGVDVDSTIWDASDNTANGVMMIFCDAAGDIPNGGNDSQAQWVFVAQIEVSGSEVTAVYQDAGQVGGISDSDPLNLGLTDGSSDAEGLSYSIEYIDEQELELQVFGGSWKQHLNDGVTPAAPVVFSQADLILYQDDGIYLTILPDEATVSSATQDPNLVVTAPYITFGNPAFADNFNPVPWETNARANNGLILAAKNGVVDMVGSEDTPILDLEVFNGGPVYNDYIRPDGFNTNIGLVDTTYPRGAGLGINAEAIQEGVLEDYKFHEKVLTANDIGQYNGDYIGMYYDYQNGALTEKEYYRIDSHDADSWGAGVSGKSLSVTTNNGNTFLEITNFFSDFNAVANSYDIEDTDFAGAGTGSGEYVLVGKRLDDPNDVVYINPTISGGGSTECSDINWSDDCVPCSAVDFIAGCVPCEALDWSGGCSDTVPCEAINWTDDCVPCSSIDWVSDPCLDTIPCSAVDFDDDCVPCSAVDFVDDCVPCSAVDFQDDCVPCTAIDWQLNAGGFTACLLHNELDASGSAITGNDRRSDYGPNDDQDYRYIRILSGHGEENDGPALLQSLGYADTYDNTTGTSTNPREVLDLSTNQTYDMNELLSIDLDQRVAHDSDEDPSADYQQRYLYDVGGTLPLVLWGNLQLRDDITNDIAIKWGARELLDPGSFVTYSWGVGLMYSPTDENLAIDHDTRALHADDGASIFEFSDTLGPNVPVTADYQHNGKQGDTISVTGGDLVSGGLTVNEANWQEIEIRAQPAGGGPVQTWRVLGVQV